MFQLKSTKPLVDWALSDRLNRTPIFNQIDKQPILDCNITIFMEPTYFPVHFCSIISQIFKLILNKITEETRGRKPFKVTSLRAFDIQWRRRVFVID